MLREMLRLHAAGAKLRETALPLDLVKPVEWDFAVGRSRGDDDLLRFDARGARLVTIAQDSTPRPVPWACVEIARAMTRCRSIQACWLVR